MKILRPQGMSRMDTNKFGKLKEDFGISARDRFFSPHPSCTPTSPSWKNDRTWLVGRQMETRISCKPASKTVLPSFPWAAASSRDHPPQFASKTTHSTSTFDTRSSKADAPAAETGWSPKPSPSPQRHFWQLLCICNTNTAEWGCNPSADFANLEGTIRTMTTFHPQPVIAEANKESRNHRTQAPKPADTYDRPIKQTPATPCWWLVLQ